MPFMKLHAERLFTFGKTCIWYFNDENISIDLIIGSPYDPFLFQKPREVWDRTRTSLIFCFLAEGAYITVTLQLPYSYQLVQQIMSIYSMRLQLGSTELHVHRSIKWKCIFEKKMYYLPVWNAFWSITISPFSSIRITT